MAIHWQIPFRSLRSNTLYTVNVYDDGYTGSNPIQLTGAAQPFVTEESATEDMFLPVRTQSGHLSVVDTGEGFNWVSLVPSTSVARPVTLTSGYALLWSGFIQPQTFSGTLYGAPQERRFPLCCALSALESFDVSPSVAEMANFAFLIEHIFGNLPSQCRPQTYCFGGGSVITTWLQKLVNWELFREYDSNSVGRTRYNALELLEEVCRFWGWSCRQQGSAVYFCSADVYASTEWCVLSDQDLHEMAVNAGEYYYTESFAVKDLTDATLCSVDNEESVLQGCKKAIVKADISRFDDVMTVDLDTFTEYMDKNGGSITHVALGDESHVFYRNDSWRMAEPVEQGIGRVTLDGKNCTLEIDIDTSQQPWGYYGTLYDYYVYNGELENLHDIPFTAYLCVYNHPYYDSSRLVCARIRSKHIYALTQGVLVVSASTCFYEPNASGDGVTQWNGRGILTCRMKVGDMYWDGSTWTSSPSYFDMPVGGEEVNEGQGQIPSNRTIDQTTWTSPYPNYGGHGIPVTSALTGYVEFSIHNVRTVPTPVGIVTGVIWLRDISIQFLRTTASSPRRDVETNEYTGATTSIFAGDISVSTIFATDNGNAAGFGLIMDPDGGYCSTVSVPDGGSTHIEQWVANRISSFGRFLRKKLVCDLMLDAVGFLTPLHKCELAGVDYYPLSISVDWRNDSERVTMIEL